MVIVVTFSTDSSIALALEKGNFDQLKSEVECYSALDRVWLITQDVTDYSRFFSDVAHFPCGIRVGRPIGWLVYFLRAYLALYMHASVVTLVRAYGVGCLHAALFRRTCKVPLVVSYEYDWSEQLSVIRRRVAAYLSRGVESFVFSSADIVVGLSPRLCQKAKTRGAREVVYVPNGIDADSVPAVSFPEKKRLKARLGLTDRIVILYVGRLHRIKRINDLILAAEILCAKRSDVALLVIGEGTERNNLEKLVNKKDLGSHVSFLGRVPHEQVYRLMQIADLLALPSMMEGNPRVLIEAMFCRVPIVATNVVGINDLIISGEDGLLTRPFSPNEMSVAIELILSNQGLSRRLVEQAYRKVSENFNQERLRKKSLLLVSSIMRKLS